MLRQMQQVIKAQKTPSQSEEGNLMKDQSMRNHTHLERTEPTRRQAIQALAVVTLAGVVTESASGQSSAAVKKSGSELGSRIRGVQHFGVTVQNMNRAFEFYTEVLGGTEIMRDGDFHGEPIHNTLMLHEEIIATQQHVNPHT